MKNFLLKASEKQFAISKFFNIQAKFWIHKWHHISHRQEEDVTFGPFH